MEHLPEGDPAVRQDAPRQPDEQGYAVNPDPAAPGWLDYVDLSHGRLLMLFQFNPDNLDDPPQLLVQEYDSSEQLDTMEPGGSVWFYPEDLPLIIEWLGQLLELSRRCAEKDGTRLPAPYWGNLGEPK